MPHWEGFSGWWPALGAALALGCLIVGIGAGLKRRWALRELELLRKKYQETDPTDPHYNAVRALYFAAVADAHRESGADKLGASHDTDSTGGDGAD